MKEDDELWTAYFFKKLMKNIQCGNKMEWKPVSSHPYLPINLVGSFPHMSWDWNNLSKLSFDKIQDLITIFPSKNWDWNYLSLQSPVLFIQDNPSLKWNHEKISRRGHRFEKLQTPLDYALQNTHMPWNWSLLSRHPSITMDKVFRHPSLPWDMDHILGNCPFSSFHLYQIRTTNRNYHLLSKNPHNTLHILCKNLHKPWDWTELAQNIAFAPHHVYLHKERLPLWRWDLSLRNPRLTWRFYNLIRKEVLMPRQFHHLLKNHFHHSSSFFLYFTIIIRRFLLGVFRRRVMLRKLHLLTVLKSRMDPYILHVVLFSYIG